MIVFDCPDPTMIHNKTSFEMRYEKMLRGCVLERNNTGGGGGSDGGYEEQHAFLIPAFRLICSDITYIFFEYLRFEYYINVVYWLIIS